MNLNSSVDHEKISFTLKPCRRVSVGGLFEHLITMKTATGRSKDALDIEALRDIQLGKTP